MTEKNIIRVGIIGLGQRGFGIVDTVLACKGVEIAAVCDLYEDRRETVQKYIGEKQKSVPASYAHFEDLLADSCVNVVIVSTSWSAHTNVACASMRASKITALEVGGAYSIDDCWQLVRTYEETKTPFMFLENCCFDYFELLSTALERAGKLGEIVFCSGAYSHDLRDEILGGHVRRHYRLENYLYRNCDNYPTHELGPIAKILDINRGNRMTELVSLSSKAAGLESYAKSDKNPDPALRGKKFMQGDIVKTLIRCANGELIELMLDTTLPVYYSRRLMVRGTKGLCEQEKNGVLLDESGEKILEASQFDEYLPDMWRKITKEERELGHGGMDYLMYSAFFENVRQGKEMPIDVYDAAAWMCVTVLSEQSISCGGMPQAIPDFTRGKWITRERRDVTEFSVKKN